MCCFVAYPIYDDIEGMRRGSFSLNRGSFPYTMVLFFVCYHYFGGGGLHAYDNHESCVT
jgi:hypothetical protein